MGGYKGHYKYKEYIKEKHYCLNINDIEETDPAILSDSFNTFFTAIAQN